MEEVSEPGIKITQKGGIVSWRAVDGVGVLNVLATYY